MSAAILRTNLDKKKKMDCGAGAHGEYIELDAGASIVKGKNMPTLAVRRGRWKRKCCAAAQQEKPSLGAEERCKASQTFHV